MDNLTFQIRFHKRKYEVFIDWGVNHKFKNKHQANLFIKKFKSVIHDNVLIMGNIYSQLIYLKQVFNPYLTSDVKRKFTDKINGFEKSYYMIYHNWSQDTHVQFNQIRVSFDHLIEMVGILKRHAQKNKHSVLLQNLYPIEKILYIILDAYRKDIRGLSDGISYRTEEIRLKPFNDEINTNHSKSNAS